jgi:hypothetical protein
MQKKLLLFTLSVLLTTLAMSQNRFRFYIGGGTAFNKYLEDYGKAHPAGQIRIGVDDLSKGGRRSHKLKMMLGYNFSPFVGKRDFVAPTTNGISYTYADVHQEVRINNLFFHGAWLFGKPENQFHWYIIGGGSYDFLNITYNTNAPDGYITENTEDLNTLGPKVDLGIGADWNDGSNGKFYFEFLYGIKANAIEVGNASSNPAVPKTYVEIDNPTVNHWGIIIGYSFYFNGNGMDYYED